MDSKSRLTTFAEIAGIIGTLLALFAFASQMGWLSFFNSATTQVASAATPTLMATLAPSATPMLMPTPTDTPLPTPTMAPSPTRTIAPPTSTPTITPRPPTLTPTPTPTPGIGSSKIFIVDGATMMFVPAGEFTMGSNDNDDERPPHPVSLDAFWMDKFEVSNALYKKCVDAGKCAVPSEKKSFTRPVYYGDARYDHFPVIYVSWNDANAYCTWAGKRLPTEAEWEKAARGPSSEASDRRMFPWGNTFDANLVNSSEGFRGDTVAVDSLPNGASGYGMLNLAGNVWEWVADWYDPNYYANAPRNNPKGPSAGQQRVLRGGAWFFNQLSVRTSLRFNYQPGSGSYLVGFRCVQ